MGDRREPSGLWSLWVFLLLAGAVTLCLRSFGPRGLLLIGAVGLAMFLLRGLLRYAAPIRYRLNAMRDDRERCLAVAGLVLGVAAVQVSLTPVVLRLPLALAQNVMLFAAIETAVAAWLVAGGGRPRHVDLSATRTFTVVVTGMLLAAVVAGVLFGPLASGWQASGIFASPSAFGRWTLGSAQALPAVLSGDANLWRAGRAWTFPLGVVIAVLFALVASLRLTGRSFGFEQVARYAWPRMDRLAVACLVLLAGAAVLAALHGVLSVVADAVSPIAARMLVHLLLDAATMATGILALTAAITRAMRRPGSADG